MKKFTVHISETDTEFEVGTVFRPKWSEMQAVLGKIRELGLEEELMPYGFSVVQALESRGGTNKAVPDMLAKAAYRKLHKRGLQNVTAILWFLACYSYAYCKGPYPGTLKSYPKLRDRKPISQFRCPYCGNEFEPPKRYKNREPILKAFGKWITNHEQCHNGNHIHIAPEVK